MGMTPEHRRIINQAHKLNISPSELASELLERDLIETPLTILRKQKAVFSSLSENAQEAIIRELEDVVHKAVASAITILAARGAVAVPVTLKSITVDAGLKVVANVDSETPHRHALVDAANHLCLLVLAPHDYDAATDSFEADKDQPDLLEGVDAEFEEVPERGALQQLADQSVAGTGLAATVQNKPKRTSKSKEEPQEPVPTLDEGLYADAVLLVQREKKVNAGFLKAELAVSEEQAESIIQRMEIEKIVSEENDMGGRAVFD